MKTMRLSLLAFVLVTLFSSCDKFNEKSFSASFHKEFLVTVSEEDGAMTIDLEKIMSALDNSDIEKYKESIKSYELINIRYKVWEYAGDPGATFTGNLGVGNALTDVPGVLLAMEGLSLQSSNDDPEYRQFEKTEQDIDKIEQYFLDTDGLTLFLDGTVTHQPMSFKLDIWVDVKALAEIED
jgi:hypothetical protein